MDQKNRSEDQSSGNSSLECNQTRIDSLLCQQSAMDAPLDTQVSKWDCDHIFGRLSDYSAAFLDMATQQHPLVLTRLALDASGLSSVSFRSLREVVRRSNLEHLNIMCTFISPNQSESITKVLRSFRWPSLTSLAISGGHIDGWLQLWPPQVGARLSIFRSKEHILFFKYSLTRASCFCIS